MTLIVPVFFTGYSCGRSILISGDAAVEDQWHEDVIIDGAVDEAEADLHELAETPQDLLLDEPNPDEPEQDEAEETNALYWARTYGGPEDDEAVAITETPDGGYLVLGGTSSFGAGDTDIWIFKIDAGGHVVWEKTLGTENADGASDIQPTADGGYTLAGSTEFPYEEEWMRSNMDILIIKVDENGNVVWQKTYGDSRGPDTAFSVRQTADGGYVVAGIGGCYGPRGPNGLVLRLDGNGSVLWGRTHCSPGGDYATVTQPTADGGFAVIDVGIDWDGICNFVFTRLDSEANVVWSSLFWIDSLYCTTSLELTLDNGYILASNLFFSEEYDVDTWILKLDEGGNMLWQKRYGGDSFDLAPVVRRDVDGGFVVAATTESFGSGGRDIWILKLSSDGDVMMEKTCGGTEDDEAVDCIPMMDGGTIIAGNTSSFGSGGMDIWILKLDDSGNISDTCPSGFGLDSSSENVATTEVPSPYLPEDFEQDMSAGEISLTERESSAIVETQCSR